MTPNKFQSNAIMLTIQNQAAGLVDVVIADGFGVSEDSKISPFHGTPFCWYYGKNDGNEPVELIVFYAGIEGTPITLPKGDEAWDHQAIFSSARFE
ncbi:hypothetical protein KK062_23420 [Fulvivirgaceae bacterium PWU5]|uniref:Uncharacterized protein n=1 Tax=Dawidia cretensis TaxID=2782350 RepID=A0AAP2E415_9BACT|nr:hypothetical protein [Dawidia cretensis]MBT1711214.1 hypothetical protein [Dawidia cretensis]